MSSFCGMNWDGSELCNQAWSFGWVTDCGILEFYIPWVVYPWIPPKWAVLVAKMMKLINHQFFFGYPIFNQIHILHTSWVASLRRSTSLSMDCDKMWQPEPVCSILIPWIVKEPGITSGISWYLPIFSMVHRLIVVKAFAKGLTPSCQMSNSPWSYLAAHMSKTRGWH